MIARLMPEFLVHITVNAPPDMPEARKGDLADAEARRGRELIEQGSLLRIWRLPGRWANVSLYRCADATELHELVSSLPMFPWLDVSVEALATHPLEA
jgi:muconolactone D-isomerase